MPCRIKPCRIRKGIGEGFERPTVVCGQTGSLLASCDTRYMPEWREYEVAAAEFFRELGLQAEHDQKVKGARATHQVDVLVTTRQFGIEQMWVVECKLRTRLVEKQCVMTLAGVVDDVGADRGFLLSEVGFQSGAVQAARKRNITLTSLADLRANAEDDLAALELTRARQKIAQLTDRLMCADDLDRNLTPGTGFWVPSEEISHCAGNLSSASRALDEAAVGHWPVLYGYVASEDRGLRAANPAELASGLQEWLDAVDRVVGSLEDSLKQRARSS